MYYPFPWRELCALEREWVVQASNHHLHPNLWGRPIERRGDGKGPRRREGPGGGGDGPQ